MAQEALVVGRATQPKERPGAPRVKPGQYLYEPAKIPQWRSGPDYSPANGNYVIGARTIVGLHTFAVGTNAEPHSHNNEQWMYILDGEIEMTVEDVTFAARPGQFVYIPANAVHSVRVTSTMDLRFLAVKDAEGDVSATNWDD